MGDVARWQMLKGHLASLDPNILPNDLLHLVRAVADAHDPAMTCDECRAWLPAYVDAEVGGLAAGQSYPHVKRHLDLCHDCEAEYLEMLELSLAEDAGEVPIPEEFPAPDLAFLPPIPLSAYVRSLAEELVAAAAPHLVSDLQAIMDAFFERVAKVGKRFILGPTFAPAMGFGSGEVPEALKLLAATYAATQSLVETLSPQEIEAQARGGQLQDTLRRQAERAGRDMGLSPQEARAFAEKYAELTDRDPEALQELAAHQDG